MKALPVLNPKAAGIDLGSENLHGLIAGDVPKVFGTFTGDLESLRDWFQAQGVQTVAMEATGSCLAVCPRSAGSSWAGGGGGQRLPWAERVRAQDEHGALADREALRLVAGTGRRAASKAASVKTEAKDTATGPGGCFVRRPERWGKV